MADRYWDGGTSTDPTNVNNWSDTDGGGTPASSVPGTGDVANFTANGDGNACTATAHWALGGLVVLVGYTSKIDLATFNLTMDDGADITLDGAGEFDLGSGTHTVTNCVFDFQNQGTWTEGTSTVVMKGTGVWASKFNGRLYDVEIFTGAAIDISALSSGTLYVKNSLAINGALSVSAGRTLNIEGACPVDFGSSGSITGVGSLWLSSPQTTGGITSFTIGGSSITIANAVINWPRAEVTFVAMTWDCTTLLKIRSSATSAKSITFGAGTHTFNCDVEFEKSGSNVFTINSGTNDASLVFTADVIWDEQAGTMVWATPGSGTITLSGSATQDVNFGGETVEALIVNKSAGTLTLDDDVTTASFTGTSTGTGDFDPNGKTITTVANCSWAAAFDFNAGATTMNGCSWIVGGNFTADGQTLLATAAWVLTVTGTAVASGEGEVEYSNAEAGTEIIANAVPWTDGNNNANWNFVSSIDSISLGGGLDEYDMPIVVRTDKKMTILI